MTDRMSYRVNLEMNDVQARTIIRALDLFARVGIGQLEVVLEELDRLFPRRFKTPEDRELVGDLLKVIKKTSLLQSNGSYGIGHREVHEDAKIAWDLAKTLQQTVAHQERHISWSVWHDGNSIRYSQQPVARSSIME